MLWMLLGSWMGGVCVYVCVCVRVCMRAACVCSFFDRLQFYPDPADTPLEPSPAVCVANVGQVVTTIHPFP
jgi:hypothetical protein